jgi:hypothetical protein
VTSWTVPDGKEFVGTAFWVDGSGLPSVELQCNGNNHSIVYSPGAGGPGKTNPLVFDAGDVITTRLNDRVTLSGFLYDRAS